MSSATLWLSRLSRLCPYECVIVFHLKWIVHSQHAHSSQEMSGIKKEGWGYCRNSVSTEFQAPNFSEDIHPTNQTHFQVNIVHSFVAVDVPKTLSCAG